MAVLIIGVIVFFAPHVLATRRDLRAQLIVRYGMHAYRGAHSLVSIIGFVLIAWGFHLYREHGLIQLWDPPHWTRHLTMLLMWFAFIALACAVPAQGRIRGMLHHPMLVAIKIWALAHLLANGDLGGMILFGSFLAFAVYDRIAVKKRGDAGAQPAAAFTGADAAVVIGGTLAYVAMIFLHPVLIGVPVTG